MYIPFSSFLFSFITLIFSSIEFIIAIIIVFLFPTLIICVLSIFAFTFFFPLMNSFTVPSLLPSFQSTPFITTFFLLFSLSLSLSALSFFSSILLILPNRSFSPFPLFFLFGSLFFTSFPFLFYFSLHLLFNLLFKYPFYFLYHCLEPSFHFLNFCHHYLSIPLSLVGVSFSDQPYLSNVFLESALFSALPIFLDLPLFVAIFCFPTLLCLPRFWLPNLISSSFSNLYLPLVPDFFSLFFHFPVLCSPVIFPSSCHFVFPSPFSLHSSLFPQSSLSTCYPPPPSPRTKPKVHFYCYILYIHYILMVLLYV